MDDDEKISGLRETPFGDTFGSKADYSLGMFYASRRKFLKDNDDNKLQPPNEFMTRKQSLNFVRMLSNDKLNSLQNMAYFQANEKSEQAAADARRKRLLKGRQHRLGVDPI